MNNASLSLIYIYPIKSLDGVKVNSIEVLTSGALKGDRQLALFDEQGKYINAKRHSKIQQLRASYDLTTRSIVLGNETFHLDEQRDLLAEYFGDYFGQKVYLREDTTMGFPDDTDSPGPTIVSTATLQTVASWYEGMTIEQVRQRFRTNLEIDGVPPFWEDRLFGEEGENPYFKISQVTFQGINPCQRCIVPTRHPHTAIPTNHFQKVFTHNRQIHLPEWTATSRFNHYYRLAVNTRLVAGENMTLHLHDSLSI